MSENISVRSIVGVYLEHSRIYYFENGGSPEVFVGSGDIMTRNMFKRIECIFPVEDPEIKGRICGEILSGMLADNKFATFPALKRRLLQARNSRRRASVFMPGTFLRPQRRKGGRPRNLTSA